MAWRSVVTVSLPFNTKQTPECESRLFQRQYLQKLANDRHITGQEHLPPIDLPKIC
jgi:hypothetical protein